MTAPVKHETRAHSSLGASGAYRWMPCPASIRLSQGKPDNETEAAALGTAVHEIGEKCLRAIVEGKNHGRDAEDYMGDEIKVGAFTFVVNDDMVHGAQMYVDTVMAEWGGVGQLFIETKFSLEHVHPGMFGTGDACVYNPETKKLTVIDYKNGRHVVEVEDNPQLKYYGIGALQEIGDLPVETIELVVVQPNASHADGPVRRWATDPLTLIDFMADLKDAAIRTEDPAQQPVAGDWCGYCRAAPDCPALQAAAIAAARLEFQEEGVYEMSSTSIAEILARAGLVEHWIKAVKQEAFRRADALGEEIPGHKLVAKRATRKWLEHLMPEDIALEMAMRFGIDDADTVYNRKIKSPAQMEKGLTRDQKAELKELYESRSSGNKLVPIADPAPARPPSGRTPADDFEPVED